VHLVLHGSPAGLDAFVLQRAGEQHRQPADVGHRACGGVGIEVGLVDHHQVGQLHHAALDGLQIVAGVGQLQQQEQIGHPCHGRFALADADGFDDHDVEPRRFAQQQRLARVLGHAAERARGRRRPDEGGLVDRQALHARLVAEDRAARQRR
jgi:hypothetical protein